MLIKLVSIIYMCAIMCGRKLSLCQFLFFFFFVALSICRSECTNTMNKKKYCFSSFAFGLILLLLLHNIYDIHHSIQFSVRCKASRTNNNNNSLHCENNLINSYYFVCMIIHTFIFLSLLYFIEMKRNARYNMLQFVIRCVQFEYLLPIQPTNKQQQNLGGNNNLCRHFWNKHNFD